MGRIQSNTAHLGLWSVFAASVLVYTAGVSCGQIYNYKTNQVIPGTQTITPGPGIDLSGWNTAGHQLEDAELGGEIFSNHHYTPTYNLNTASFANSDLAGADFSYSIMTNVNFTNADLADTNFFSPTLVNANFTGAIVAGAYFGPATGSNGFSANQLYSTASYATENLAGLNLGANDLTGWNFTNQNLTSSVLSNSTLTNANLTGATITGALFYNEVGFTSSQLYSTASYVSGNLTGIGFDGDNLSGWSFANQNLTHADFGGRANLSSANFSNANLSSAYFSGASLTNTNFANANLTFADLNGSNSANANFTGANLTFADFDAILTGANFSGANLGLANFAGADLRGAIGWTSQGETQNTIQPDGSIQDFYLWSNGTLSIRNNPIAVTVNGFARFDFTSMLGFELQQNWTSPLCFPLGSIISLDGTLDLGIAPGVDPASLVGQTFQIFEWGQTLPAGDEFFQIKTDPRLNWDLSDLYTTGVVSVSAIPEPASALILAAAAGGLLMRRKRRPISRRHIF